MMIDQCVSALIFYAHKWPCKQVRRTCMYRQMTCVHTHSNILTFACTHARCGDVPAVKRVRISQQESIGTASGRSTIRATHIQTQAVSRGSTRKLYVTTPPASPQVMSCPLCPVCVFNSFCLLCAQSHNRDHMHCPGTYSSLFLFCVSAHSDAIVGSRGSLIKAPGVQCHSTASPSAPMPVPRRCTGMRVAITLYNACH